MENENLTAETKEVDSTSVDTKVNSDADINQDEVVTTKEVEFTDSDEVSSSEEDVKKTNSENARRRREMERQREIKQAREKAIIETLSGKNPYNNEDMKDSADVEEYLTMKEIEAKGGDPLADYSKYHKAKEKEKIAKESQDEQNAEWYAKDKNAFTNKYPDVKLDSLVQDKQFQLFASGKVGKLPMTEIYEGFVSLVSSYEKKSKQIAKQLVANSKSTPGSLSSPNANDNGYFTREQVQKMTQKEVSENYDKIRTSMSKWKN